MAIGSVSSIIVPLHREGHKFVAAFGLATALLFVLWAPAGWLGVVLTLWCAYFFRDPDRITPQVDGALTAPADGIVQLIDEAPLPPELGMGDGLRTRICIFMNVFNVHVNRVPAAGRIERLAYVPGKFFNASLDKASEFNERQLVAMRTEDGKSVVFVQIAGLVARRIVCDIEEGQQMDAGQRFGIIRFGSRVDVYLDEGFEPMVNVGQIAVAGETVIADSRFGEVARDAAVR